MKKFFSLIAFEKQARWIASVLLSIVVTAQIVILVYRIINRDINANQGGTLVMEIALCTAMVIGLMCKKMKFCYLLLCIFKVYDGIHYPFVALNIIDKFKGEFVSNRQVATGVMFLFCCFILFVTFILFIIHFLNQNIYVWYALKLTLIIASVVGLVCYILMLTFYGSEHFIPWVCHDAFLICLSNAAMYYCCECIDG